jgi:hypothetical protein
MQIGSAPRLIISLLALRSLRCWKLQLSAIKHKFFETIISGAVEPHLSPSSLPLFFFSFIIFLKINFYGYSNLYERRESPRAAAAAAAAAASVY